jgi:hypothetical protein
MNKCGHISLLAILALASTAIAQAPATEEEVKKTGPDYLAQPMQTAETNLSALEESGTFRVTAKEYRPVGNGHAPAMVWTISVLQPVTYRLAQRELEKRRNARFYYQGSTGRRIAYSRLMQYSPRLDKLAGDRRLNCGST